MEGSAAVAPAAADANGQVQAPEAPVTDPTQVTQPTEQAPEADSVEARLAAAEKRAQEAEAKLAETAQEGPQDLLSALADVDVALTPEDLAAAQLGEQPGEEGENEVSDQQVQEFEGWLKDQIQEHLTPLQEERADEQVRAWQDKHPDATPNSELGKKLLATIQSLASQYGPGAAKDPSVLNLAYAAAKAELADAGAVPAEQAAENGASLETQPGQTQTGDPTEEEQYKQTVYGSAAGAGRGSGFR